MAERARYFTGEYLQSGDFTDEQSYHVAMRRLLNQELHLHGIVKGLKIVQDANSVPSTSAQFLSVTPGFAIDQIGREIYVTAPASLTPLLSLAGLTIGYNELWIVYTETATGSPAPGYQLCNQLAQSTRWTESYALVLRPCGVPPSPNTPDPKWDLHGVCLGVVTLYNDPKVGLYFTLAQSTPWYSRRGYVKIRAQSIIAPDDIAQPDPYVFYGSIPTPQVFPPPPEGYIHIKTPLGVYSEGNMLVQENMLIGDDFVLDPTTPAGVNLQPASLSSPGNLKISGNLYLQGNFFNYDVNTGVWAGIDSQIQSLIPDIKFEGPIAFNNLDTATVATQNLSQTINNVTSKLPKISTLPDVQAYVSAYSFVSANDMQKYIAAGISAVPSVTVNAFPSWGTAANAIDLNVTCTVAGGNLAIGVYNFLISSVIVNVLVVFH